MRNGVNEFGILIAGISLGVFLWVYRLGLKMTFKKRMAFLCVAMLLAISGASFTVCYLNLFPETARILNFEV